MVQYGDTFPMGTIFEIKNLVIVSCWLNPFPKTPPFETIPNSKTKQTTIEMWLLMDFMIQTALKNIVEKGEIAHFEQFHLFPQCFPKGFFFNVLK